MTFGEKLVENEQIYLFNIISSVFRGSEVSYLMDDLDYPSLFETARSQGLTGFLCEGLRGIFLPEKIEASHKKYIESFDAAYAGYRGFLRALSDGGASCIELGGGALGGLYPKRFLREVRDFDLLIREGDREKSREIAKKHGFSHVRECIDGDYFFKPPNTRVAVKTRYLGDIGAGLWEKAKRKSESSPCAISPEDRYITSLYALKSSLDQNKGQVKQLIDIFALKMAFDHSFNAEYIKNEVELLSLGFFEIQVKGMYKSLFLREEGALYDKTIVEKLFREFPKKLPPRYVSPEKEAFLKKVKKYLIITGVFGGAVTLIATFLLLTGSLPDGENRGESSGQILSAGESSGTGITELTLSDGVYRGEVYLGLPDGEGRMEYFTGDIYIGGFAAGKKQGYGVLYLATGSRYEGGFDDGFMTGIGTFYYAAGDIVSGSFVKGLPNGECKFIYSNGSVYEGELENGIRQGEGRFVYENGDEYIGGFVGGDKSGFGVYTWEDGSVFSGEWEENQELRGVYTDANGSYEGGFKNGKFSGSGKYIFANGDVYTGNFINGLENDTNGTLTYKTGGRYEGGFAAGVFSGKGVMFLPNGDNVKGNFVLGKLEGEAEYYYSEQDVTQIVIYENGEIIEYKSVIY